MTFYVFWVNVHVFSNIDDSPHRGSVTPLLRAIRCVRRARRRRPLRGCRGDGISIPIPTPYPQKILWVSVLFQADWKSPWVCGDGRSSPYPTHTHGDPHTHGSPATTQCPRCFSLKRPFPLGDPWAHTSAHLKPDDSIQQAITSSCYFPL